MFQGERIKKLEELVASQEKVIEMLKSKGKEFTFVQKPRQEEEEEYQKAISQLREHPYYQYYFALLRSSITERLLTGASADFVKGQLALLDTIASDAKFSWTVLKGGYSNEI